MRFPFLAGRRWLALSCLLLAFSTPARPADDTPPGADVASVRAWLLQHNPELRAREAETEAARA